MKPRSAQSSFMAGSRRTPGTSTGTTPYRTCRDPDQHLPVNQPRSGQPMRLAHLRLAMLGCSVLLCVPVARAVDPLPSWNDGPAKKAVIEFVAKVTKEGDKDFVP